MHLTLALFSSLLGLSLSIFNPKSPGMGSMPVASNTPLGGDDKDIERVVYPCYRDAHCKLGPEAKLEMGKCVDKFPRKDQDQMIGTMNKLGYSTKEMGSNSVKVVTQNYFCKKPQAEMKKVFTNVVRDLIQFLTKNCATASPQCAVSQEAAKCITDRIAIHQEAGECLPED